MQPKICFFAWEATKGKIITLDRLQKGVLPLLIDATFVLSKKKLWTISSSIVSRQDLCGSSSSLFLGLLG